MRLKHEEVLNKDVQNPPTEEALAAKAHYQRVAGWFLIGYWCMVLVIFATGVAIGNPALLLTSFLGLMLGVGLWLIHDGASYYEPIPKHACEAAFECFSATDAGVKYLHNIREQGRQVTEFDVDAAKCWKWQVMEQETAKKQSRQQEAACKKLYGIDA